MGDRERRQGPRGTLAALTMLCCLAAPALGAGPKTSTPAAMSPATGNNPYNEALMRMSPPERAAKLATVLGMTCIGTKPFLMGVTKEGPAKGYAYWSLECAGGQSYMIQIAPDGEGAAIDCRTFNQNAEGRQCYKAF